MIRSLHVLAGFLFSCVAAAQQPGIAVVAVDAGVTLLVEVDLATGGQQILASFPSAASSPLALGRDPITGELLVALASGSDSRLVALAPAAGQQFTERLLGVVPGRAVDVFVDSYGDVCIATNGAGGGVHRLSRWGGGGSLVRAEPRVTAIGASRPLSSQVLLGASGQAGPPVVDPRVTMLDLGNGQFVGPVETLAGFLPRSITGMVELPTAVPRALLIHGDGSFSLHAFGLGANPTPVATSPTLPPGGAQNLALDPRGLVLLVGDQRDPRLWSFDPFAALSGPVALTQIGTALPADPVGLVVVPQLQAEVIRFARSCGSATELRIGVPGGAGLPQVGNSGFSLGMFQGLPGQPALLALGFDEGPVAALPNGCTANVTPAAIALHFADAQGEATQPLAVPALPALIGALLYGQWFQDDLGSPFVTSDVLAIRVGP